MLVDKLFYLGLDYLIRWDYISNMTLMATAELKSLVIHVATESVSKFCKRPHKLGVGDKVITKGASP